MKAQPNQLRLLLNLVIAAALLALAGAAARSQDTATKRVSLEGQLVCSECWFEADRKTTAYGTPADLQCAADCAVKGVPPAVAVKQGDEFRLYLVEAGQIRRTGDEWLADIGKWVKVSGRLQAKKDKQYVAVDELKVLPATQESARRATALGTAAELTLKDLFGVEQKLSAYRGKLVVLNFWATWCIPCRKEMPDLAAIQNDYAALGVQVIGAAADTLADRSKVLQFVKETRINFPVWVGATTEEMQLFGLGPALPGTAVIGRDGKILSIKHGVVTQVELRKQLDTLLGADAVTMKGELAVAKSPRVEASLVPS